MNRPSFNVLTEPWIPVIRLDDGSTDELGILRCLEEAHELREIRDPAPIIEFGLHRLLVAFVLDALILADRRPEDVHDLRDLIADGRIDPGMIEAYVEQCGDVFDLFDLDRPFLQTRMDDEAPKPLAALFPAVPSGTNASHWHHGSEDEWGVGPDEAARVLSTLSPFMTAGGRGLKPSVNGAPAIYALPAGRNLFETLVLNIPTRASEECGDGAVAWRSERSPGTDRSEATVVEMLTWRPRRIQLIPDSGNGGRVLVRQMRFEQGDSTRLRWIDSSLAYRYDKDKVTPVRMREDRVLWRDAGSLLLLREDEHGRDDKRVAFRRPGVVDQAFELTDDHDSLVIRVYGVRTDMKAKIFEWAKSAWSVPSALGRSERLGSVMQHELDRAEQAAYRLRRSVRGLHPAEDIRSLGQIVSRCERAYWHRLESGFHALMSAFAALEDDAADDPSLLTATAGGWRDGIRSTAVAQFELAAKDMDVDGDALERQVRARSRLHIGLKEVLS